jgi:hypothetical protein
MGGSAMNDNTDDVNSKRSIRLYIKKLISVLKDFKELIALVAFFAGGAVWTVNYFATRQQLEDTKAQMEEYRCISETSFQMIQGSMSADFMEQVNRSAKRELRETRQALQNPKLSSEIKTSLLQQQEDLENQIEDFKGTKTKAKVDSEKAFEKLRSNGCRNESQIP